jgi:hypothetical protein
MRFIIAGQHHKRHLEVLLELIVVRQILHLFAALFKRQTMIGKIGHRKGVAGILQLM